MASSGQKVVLITGCSSGIGLRIAVLLAKDEKKRYHVIATMRNLKKKDKLVEAAGDVYGKSLMLLPLDVCSDESVKHCINSVKDRHIDILINNAGVGLLGPVESISMEEMKRVFETNFFGVFAMEGFCESMAVQLLKFNIHLSMIEPGPVHTEFETKMMDDVAKMENLTNSLYTPIIAMKYADETGGLSVNTFYNLLFNFGPIMHITMSILKTNTSCSVLREKERKRRRRAREKEEGERD
ncbi:unnamed protein product [Coregonus sp. 'balchen']|nr:unnamed protein product [Coregonus sp. 'balchen']